MSYEINIDVRYPDCDSMGIVHHAVYPIWLEMGRMDFFAKCKAGYSDAKARNVDPAMVNLNMNYGLPVKFPGTITLRTTETLLSGKKLGFKYEIFAENGEKPIFTATSFHIWVRNGASVNLETEEPELFGKYLSGLEQENN